MSAKQTEAALIVGAALMKSAAAGLRNDVHASPSASDRF